jgi:hypothetical protein
MSVLPNYVYKKLQICKIFVITNICNQTFATFGRIGHPAPTSSGSPLLAAALVLEAEVGDGVGQLEPIL